MDRYERIESQHECITSAGEISFGFPGEDYAFVNAETVGEDGLTYYMGNMVTLSKQLTGSDIAFLNAFKANPKDISETNRYMGSKSRGCTLLKNMVNPVDHSKQAYCPVRW